MAVTNVEPKDGTAEINNRSATAVAVESAAPRSVVRRSTAKMRRAVAELEVPFNPALIEWRIMKIEHEAGRRKGLLMPYADPRAYTDRLNALFTPAGWTRSYSVHSSANFERSRDGKMVAKVFVTCDLKVFGLGTHSATGEQWTDDENAGTSAEAQAFKRACSCFGMGRYLYSFGGVWVELDERNCPKEIPRLVGWATPQGWREGLRPGDETGYQLELRTEPEAGETPNAMTKDTEDQERRRLVAEIESMAERLGKRLYRGLLKSVAMVWRPEDIKDLRLLDQVAADMQSAQAGLERLHCLAAESGPESLRKVLYSFALRSVEEIATLERLQAIVTAAEAACTIKVDRQ